MLLKSTSRLFNTITENGYYDFIDHSAKPFLVCNINLVSVIHAHYVHSNFLCLQIYNNNCNTFVIRSWMFRPTNTIVVIFFTFRENLSGFYHWTPTWCTFQNGQILYCLRWVAQYSINNILSTFFNMLWQYGIAKVDLFNIALTIWYCQ